jgi:hypothetical protein
LSRTLFPGHGTASLVEPWSTGGTHGPVAGASLLLYSSGNVSEGKEAMEVLDKMSQGDLSTRMLKEYKGDHAKIKNAINNFQDINQRIVEDIKDTLIEEATKELNQYQKDAIVQEYLDQGVNLKKVILLFHGWELIKMMEVE